MANNSRFRGRSGYYRPDYPDSGRWDDRYHRYPRSAGGPGDEAFADDDTSYATSRWYEDNSRGEMPPYLGESFNTHGYGGATGPEVDVRRHFGAAADYGEDRPEWHAGRTGVPAERLHGNRYNWGGRPSYPAGGPAAFAEAAGIYRGHGPKGYSRKDERIDEDVSEALAQDPYLDASAIEVKVKDGVVTLEGEVPTRQMKHRAENCADACSGVKDIENHLRVRPANVRTGTDPSGV